MTEPRSVEVNFAALGHSGDSFVKIDGKEVKRVTRVSLDLSVGDVPMVTIECYAADAVVQIDEADVSIEPRVHTRKVPS